MKIHVPIQIILDPEDRQNNGVDNGAQAAFRHALTKIAIKATVAHGEKGFHTKTISKDMIGKGGAKSVWRSKDALPRGTEFRDYALMKLFNWDASVVSEVITEMIVLGIKRQTIYLSLRPNGKVTVTMFVPVIKGKSKFKLQKGGDKRIAASVFVQWFKQVEQLHQAGFCHYDIKPDNMLFDEATGNVTLIDFGGLRRPWQASKCQSRGYSLALGELNIAGFDQHKLEQYNRKWYNLQLTLAELPASDTNYENIKGMGLELAMFGVHCDMAAMLKVAVENCGLMEDFRQECTEAFEHEFHPFYMTALVNAVIQRHQLDINTVQLTPFNVNLDINKLRRHIAFNFVKSQMSRENLNSFLDRVPRTNGYFNVEGGRYGGTIGFGIDGSKNGIEIERNLVGSRGDEKDIRWLESHDQNLEEKNARKGLQDLVTKLTQRDPWFAEFARALQPIKSSCEDTPNNVQTNLRNCIEGLITLTKQKMFLYQDFAYLLTKVLVLSLMDSDGNKGGKMFMKLYQVMTHKKHKEKLAKFWNLELQFVNSRSNFYEVVKRVAMIHECYKPVFQANQNTLPLSSNDHLVKAVTTGLLVERHRESIEKSGTFVGEGAAMFDFVDRQWNGVEATYQKGNTSTTGHYPNTLFLIGEGKLSVSTMKTWINREANTTIEQEFLKAKETVAKGVGDCLLKLFHPDVIVGLEAHYSTDILQYYQAYYVIPAPPPRPPI